MKEQITVIVSMTFECNVGQNIEAQLGCIDHDIGRLLDADTTAGVVCIGYDMTSIPVETNSTGPSTATHMIFAICGSENVRADAYAAWDSEQSDWVLHSVYDEKTCENCERGVTLIEIDEATGLEVQAFGMISDQGAARLVHETETPEFYDLIVKTMADGGNILTLHEFEEMSRAEVDKCIENMAMLYPNAPVSCFFGQS